MNIFWETIAQYNAGTWIYQLIITLVGLWLTYSLFHHPTPAKKKGMKLYLIFINAWVAVVYYHIYCDPRSYSNALALFWGIMCFFWIYDLIVDYTPFELNHKHKKLAVLLCFLPLAYPLFSVARGMDFPMMTSPVMPCSVAVFTIGLLLAFSQRVNLFLILFLCHWALIGFTKTYFFQIPEDFLLASATIPGLYLFFREYFLNNLHADTKPKAKYINWLLITVCVGLAILLTTTMFLELVPKN